jgi:predicted transcriptional regulator
MFGLGKPRSKLGKWLDSRGITQQWISRKTKLNKATVSRICSESDYIPSGTSIHKIIKAIKEIDSSVSANKFWDM